MTASSLRSAVRAARVLSLLVAGLLLAACAGDDCVLPSADGLRIRVLDAGTLQPIGPIPTVTISDGAYTETLTPDSSRPTERIYVGANERPGTYSVRVEALGFTTATQSNITVSRDRQCGLLQPVEVTIALPANPS